MSQAVTGGALGSHPMAGRWVWFLLLGIVMLLLGVLALGDVVLVTIVSTIFIGAMLVVAGVMQLIHAFANKGWGAFLLALLCGAVYILGGFLIMAEPVQGSILVTIVLAAALAVGGVLRVIIALRHRELSGWWVLLLGGLISVGIAVWLYLSLPWSGLFLLGTLVAIELIVQGVTWIAMGLTLRAIR